MTITRSDDTNAFGGNLLTITLTTELLDVVITKAIFQCGRIKKEYNNPTFPITVNLTSEETELLTNVNTGYLLLFDENVLRKTCEGSVTIKTESKKVD